MKLLNIRNSAEEATFIEATLRGSAAGGGLYLPQTLPRFTDIDALLRQPLLPRSEEIVQRLIGDEFSREELRQAVQTAFNFPVPLQQVDERIFSLELFHGPTLAFKDFGARLMAGMFHLILQRQPDRQKITILTATSGDTGAAVAHAFFNIPGIEVRILYPAGLISPLQEKLFCTMGGNVKTFRVAGRFDDCQAMVKACFADQPLVKTLGLTSANSINFCRLLAQLLYYFEGVAALRATTGDPAAAPVIAVPSGNFGNLTAGILAQRLGLPVSRFIAATNANDVVPEFLRGNDYQPRPSVATLANAMDVGAPNNWERIVHLFQGDATRLRRELTGASLADNEIRQVIKSLWSRHQLSEPHSAIGYEVLRRHLKPQETGLFLATAHPAKFKEVVEETLGVQVNLPPALAAVENKTVLSVELPADVAALKSHLVP